MGSLASNNLTNNGKDMSGIIKLCESLKSSSLTSLRCRASLLARHDCSSPCNMHFTCTRSIAGNYMGDEGGKALAAVLPQTKLTSLEYAAAHTVLA